MIKSDKVAQMSSARGEPGMGSIQRIHFIGIGGVGMSGIAEVLLNLGYEVSGSDLSENTAVKRLMSKGAKVYIGHAAEYVLGSDVVVISSAVHEDNPEADLELGQETPVGRLEIGTLDHGQLDAQ